MLMPHGTVVAVLDGKALELFRNSGNEAEPELVAVSAPKLVEHNKSGGARHASSSANHAGHQSEEDAHAVAVVDWLNQQVAGHAIQHLVVIAPPKTLGEMRRRYSRPLEAALLREVHKEMTKRSGREILAALR
ncbi:host attachment protein [Terricaulis sp.]|uniref:host attachment protein n=1 Tax=Terricaulis sp. TaxID=2768686 RepID=UPI0037850187